MGGLLRGALTARARAQISVAIVVIATFLVPLVPAEAQTTTRAERERVRRERAQLAAELNVLRANDAELNAAIDALQSQVAAEEQALEAARQAVDAATAEAEAAAARAAETAAEAAQVLASMRDAAISEFITGGAGAMDDALTDATDLAALASARTLRQSVQLSADDLVDELNAVREDHEVAQAAAESAAAAAEVKRAAAAERLGRVEVARDQQVAFATELDQRIEARLAEAANLQALDAELAARLTREQAALAQRTAGISRSPVAVARTGSVPLATVRGITVHRDIADELAALLDAAEADGLVFGGGGYRDSSQQQRLREQNCPDPQSSPASSCRPPTARPGSSMHERGLAIDFTSGGRLITSRSNPAFRWLAANAARFGFYNLPEEPWHWSTNGN
jgi:hypothetical protein